jgi:hypothetical protein
VVGDGEVGRVGWGGVLVSGGTLAGGWRGWTHRGGR